MKKIIILLLVFCLGSSLVFGVDYGMGFLTDFNYQYADWKAVFPSKTFTDSQKIGFLGIKSFIDMQYELINFGIKGSVSKTDLRYLDTGTVSRSDISTVYMTLGFLGKYPFKLKSIPFFRWRVSREILFFPIKRTVQTLKSTPKRSRIGTDIGSIAAWVRISPSETAENFFYGRRQCSVLR